MLGNLSVTGRSTNTDNSRQGHILLAVGAVGVCCDFFLQSFFSRFVNPVWKTVRYRLNFCLKGPFNLKLPTIQLH